MKKLLLSAALLFAATAASANPFANVPGYGQFMEVPGYTLTCKAPGLSKPYTYWFAMGAGTRVAISRLGLPNGAQLFARVIDGEPIQGGYDLLILTEVGRRYHVKFSGSKGIIDDGQKIVSCRVAKNSFVM